MHGPACEEGGGVKLVGLAEIYKAEVQRLQRDRARQGASPEEEARLYLGALGDA